MRFDSNAGATPHYRFTFAIDDDQFTVELRKDGLMARRGVATESDPAVETDAATLTALLRDQGPVDYQHAGLAPAAR